MKNVIGITNPPEQHWVGDGFPVRSLFSYMSHGKVLSPFLLLDYAGPQEFPPAQAHRGVGEHPHRGFETVTIVYSGEVAHRDSTGKGGVIGPGDVQWMTAAAGILHEEFHSEAFTKSGGLLEMVQLWVNLPAKDKQQEPGYQAIANADIPEVELAGGTGTARLIAGELNGSSGPARTFTPMNVWDLRLKGGSDVKLPSPEGWNTALIVLHGAIAVNGGSPAHEAQMAILSREGSGFSIQAQEDATVLLLSGEPIDEPIAGRGPFVMNTQEELVQAYADFKSGRFGRI